MNRHERRRMSKGIATPEYAEKQRMLLFEAMRFHRQRDFATAADLYRGVLKKEPDSADALANLAACLGELKEHDEAILAAQRALDINPKIDAAWNALGASHIQLGLTKDATGYFERAMKLRPREWQFVRNYRASLLYRDDLSQKEIAKRFRATAWPSVQESMMPRFAKRIGFISSDLRNHVVSNTLLPLVEYLRVNSWEIHLFAHDSAHDAITEEYKKCAERWTQIDAMTDGEAEEQIRSRRLSIVVSVSGHMDMNRPMILSRRVAPVQISMLDATTTGLATVDYFIADLGAFCSDEWFSEKVIGIPQAYGTLDGFPEITNKRTEGRITFACFGNPAKISPPCVAAWGKILASLPHARLLLGYHSIYAQRSIQERFSRAMSDNGAQPSQLSFLVSQPTREEFLDIYNSVDVALDSFPFSGATTTFQALGMGVPVVTMPGTRLVSRLSTAIMNTGGSSIGVTDRIDFYILVARILATNATADRAARRNALAASTACNFNVYTSSVGNTLLGLIDA
jgi:predicted O-linked N-acetylglucosamine transferase (SPINDLY family)